ncbi:putative dehydrogenase [Nakamurella sp. UYEF19]|uniref:Gfo/Idh/MocA family protein n=1 Tax=Nakamurella sp. UYEF19 TaxID=1756392 RepID=UPI003398078E
MTSDLAAPAEVSPDRAAPDLTAAGVQYLPVDPAVKSARIAVIGCGGISAWHLAAYKEAGYSVVALCDIVRDRAVERQQEFFPAADVYTDHLEMLARDDIDVVDIATHVDVRPDLVRAALDHGKNVLSQKPFVREISEGRSLVEYAKANDRTLAVNQNGRWTPHFAYLLSAIRSGLIGDVLSADFWVYWPHDEVVADNAIFSTMQELILFDYGIHWFDMVAQVFSGKEATEVTARTKSVSNSVISVPTNAYALIEFPDAQASVTFRGSSHLQEWAGYRVEGTKGVLYNSSDEYLGSSSVNLFTDRGTETVDLQGSWFANGMHGSMGVLLRSLEEGTVPSNEAGTALAGLQLCYAALQSDRLRSSVDPRTVNSADR